MLIAYSDASVINGIAVGTAMLFDGEMLVDYQIDQLPDVENTQRAEILALMMVIRMLVANYHTPQELTIYCDCNAAVYRAGTAFSTDKVPASWAYRGDLMRLRSMAYKHKVKVKYVAAHADERSYNVMCDYGARALARIFRARKRRGAKRMDKRDAIAVIGSAIQAYGHFESYSIPGADNCEVNEVLQKICEYYNDDTMLNKNYDAEVKDSLATKRFIRERINRDSYHIGAEWVSDQLVDEGYKLVMKDEELQIYNTKKSEYWTLPAFMKARPEVYDLFITFVDKFA